VTDDLYNQAARDFLTVCVTMIAAELAQEAIFSPEFVASKMQTARAILQGDNAIAAIAARDVPDGMLGAYRSSVGAVHDRAQALLQAALTL
jgi:predicted RecB family endonuclease